MINLNKKLQDLFLILSKKRADSRARDWQSSCLPAGAFSPAALLRTTLLFPWRARLNPVALDVRSATSSAGLATAPSTPRRAAGTQLHCATSCQQQLRTQRSTFSAHRGLGNTLTAMPAQRLTLWSRRWQHRHPIHPLLPLLSSINNDSDRETLLMICLYINSFQVELLVINANSFAGESKQHLAVAAFNESIHCYGARSADKEWLLEHQADNSDVPLLCHWLQIGLSFWARYSPNAAVTDTGSRVLSEERWHLTRHRIPGTFFPPQKESGSGINEKLIKRNLTVQRGEIWQQSTTQGKSETGKETSLSPYLMCMKHRFWISNWQPWLRWIQLQPTASSEVSARAGLQAPQPNYSFYCTALYRIRCKHRGEFLGTLTFRSMSTILCWYSTACLSFLKSSKVCMRQNANTLRRTLSTAKPSNASKRKKVATSQSWQRFYILSVYIT